MNTNLKRCLMDLFPSLKSMGGESRDIQFKLISEHYDIVDFKNLGDTNHPYSEKDVINEYYFSQSSQTVNAPYLIVKYDKVEMRGRRKVTFAPQYAYIQFAGTGNTPILRMYENTAVETGEFGNNFSMNRIDGWDRPLHPHIQNNKPCLGAFESMLYKASMSNPLEYFALLSKFYRTWNVQSPFWNINDMRPLYSRRDENGDRKRLLTSFEHERLKQVGISVLTLQKYLPTIDISKLHLSRLSYPLRVMDRIERTWNDMFYGNLTQEFFLRARRISAFTDIWSSVYSNMRKLARLNYVYYKQTAPDVTKLEAMVEGATLFFDMGLCEKVKSNWDESIEENGQEIFEALINMSPDRLLDADESSDYRRELLFSNDLINYWMLSDMECAEMLSSSIPYWKRAGNAFKEPDGEMQRFWPEEFVELDKHNQYESGKIAITKLEKQKEKIANEIRHLDKNSVENSILQQQIQF